MKRWLWLAFLLWWLPVHGEGMLTPSLHEGLKRAEKLQQAGDYRRSLKVLQPLVGKARSGIEKALVQTYLAYGWLGSDQPAKAGQAARMALENPALSKRLEPELWLLLGQAELQQGHYGPAARAFERALDLGGKEDSQLYYLLAYTLYRQKHYAKAIAYLQRALQHHRSPPEDWYRLLLACCLQGKHYALGEKVLKQMLARRPDDPARWRQLAALYFERDRFHEGLAALVAAWHEGALDRQTLLQIVHLYAHVGVPEKAARLLRRWRKEKRLPGDLKEMALEGDLWRMAREREQAVKVLRRVAEQGKDGRQWLVLAGLYMELERWKDAATAAARALQAGGGQPAQARLLLGIAAFRSGQMQTALHALQSVRQVPALLSQAEYWLGCVKGKRRCL